MQLKAKLFVLLKRQLKKSKWKNKKTFIKNKLLDFISNYNEEILKIYKKDSITLNKIHFLDFGEIKYQAAMIGK
jgi:hypothetical protein